MKKILSFLVLAPLIGLGQGVNFESGLSWQQVLAKAKAENKYIFVDCYASWCGPCKMMDRDVYPKDSVGEAMNAHFVSVKVQMDTAKSDDDGVKAWYADAHALMTTYNIGAFPSFLFFSPDGKIVHRGLGFQKSAAFVQLAADAQDAGKQYYTLLERYRAGARDFAVMPYLIKSAKTFHEPEIDSAMAADYLHGYLDKLNNAEICSKENLDFMGNVAKEMSSKDKVFLCFFKHGELADSVMHDKEYAKRFVNYIVAKEEITPVTTEAKISGKEPDWEKISKNIKHKFGPAYVEGNVVGAKVGWYRTAKDWTNYTKYLVVQMDLQGLQNVPGGLMGILILNNSAWDVFQHSDNKEELEKAVTWSDRAIQMEDKPSGNMLDTKANLLYKLGKKDEAIELETKALQLDPKAKDINETLQKMQHGEPTWATR